MKDFKHATTILFYVSYDNEVYTHEMIKELLKNKKNIVVPIADKKNRSLTLSKLDNWDDLEIGTYNILEPKLERIKKISLDSIDLIIVPGIGFDKKGNRIGHGKGYYDKLLKNSKQACHEGGLVGARGLGQGRGAKRALELHYRCHARYASDSTP